MIGVNQFLWLSGVYFLLQACGNGHSTNIPPQIKPHVAEFVAQARQRGIAVDTAGLTIVFADSLKDGRGTPINGKYTCWTFPPLGDRIELDTTQYWWVGATASANVTYSREKVIFHELGHCLLNRKHKFDMFPGDIPKSIMGLTSIDTYESFNHQYRKYYLDELFNPDMPAPCWAKGIRCED